MFFVVKKRFIYYLLPGIFFFHLLGCCREHEEKKAYDAYRMGAYVNGLEYHENSSRDFFSRLFNPLEDCIGIRGELYRDSVAIFYSRCFLVSKDKPAYAIFFEIATDSTFLAKNDKTLLFNTQICELRGQAWKEKAADPMTYGDIGDLPKVFGSLSKKVAFYNSEGGYWQDTFIEYTIQEGWIKLGHLSPPELQYRMYFDNQKGVNFVNSDTISFEFTAKSEDGDEITVTQGYMKQFCIL